MACAVHSVTCKLTGASGAVKKLSPCRFSGAYDVGVCYLSPQMILIAMD